MGMENIHILFLFFFGPLGACKHEQRFLPAESRSQSVRPSKRIDAYVQYMFASSTHTQLYVLEMLRRIRSTY
ncbi:hypothetical protein QBC32DRAFT_347899 [Pseudoneurospora amorphoporcata]|uniref:Secreted protein n=1 Tax=Pseudoneurospora amorphoporcata TaxID=241081 RepID=A0AAN6NRY8_9PEZI|nr:hypothetical protein QBC32DRAFT_347899 [Pseudoneurospora amorphoporcata]